jgi:hypothetical protein
MLLVFSSELHAAQVKKSPKSSTKKVIKKLPEIPRAPDAPKAPEAAVKSPVLRKGWTPTFGLDFFMFGPVVYEKMTVEEQTGKQISDPHYFSYGLNVGAWNNLSVLSYGGRIGFRTQQDVNNSIKATGSDAKPRYEEKVKVSSYGYNFELLIGWPTRGESNRFLPYLGVMLDQHRLQVKGHHMDEYGQTSYTTKSHLNSALFVTGFEWRWILRPFTLGMELEVLMPLASRQVMDTKTVAVSDKLGHKNKPGVKLGLVGGL